ncbi:AraC family transcriptional regulator [Bacillus sp. M6-12]|uniref:AraC family transcriptional regulator n=1 Tax=Bacillus sp. M6-12 TaxID=2054166 RepID=UPI000C772453|nr:AraC family transcriptional regulator [Bacillus sp. M6-12]PLS18233.1 AraC family transcriptional regulator [Bacillus sp. M6-12]
MAWIESLQKAIDYMEKYLLEDISIESIAEQANSSAFHFQRMFSILTDISVGDYLRRRRLTLAAQELKRTDCKIIDLAYKYGYDTPEAFSKAFRRQHGVSPTEARKSTESLKSYNRLVIEVSLKGAEPMNFKVVERDGFQAVGVKQECSLQNEQNLKAIPKLWEKLNEDGTSNLLGTMNNGQIQGVLGVCVDKSRTSAEPVMDYWIAAEYDGDLPAEFSKLEIPPSKWVVFGVHGAMPDAMQRVWKQIYSEWFPSSGFQHAGTPELEVYPKGNAYSPDYYSEIWIPIKK